jgi:hypothetical protein
VAMTPEGKVKARVKKTIQSFGGAIYCCMPVTGGYGNSGYPDFVLCVGGIFVGIETKTGQNKPTALQSAHHATIADAGGFWMVVNEDNMNSLGRVLQGILDLSNQRAFAGGQLS